MDEGTLLSIEGLKTYFFTEDGIVKSLDGISLKIQEGETVGIVGESGCGKTMTALSILQIVPGPYGKIEDGKINYRMKNSEVINIADLHSESKKIKTVRGNEISMIFQEPMSTLNPVFSIGYQLTEAIMLHQHVKKGEANKIAAEMLGKVGISNPHQRLKEYPHQFSGGMCQRVMIAMALCCHPRLLIADEPTTALDVTIEAEIIELLKNLQRDLGMSMILITHNMGIISRIAQKVHVMYAGKIIETADTESLFYNPKHPYTQGLLKSIPRIGNKKMLDPIPGTVPELIALPEGCSFAQRCAHTKDICLKKEPQKTQFNDNHSVTCWMYN